MKLYAPSYYKSFKCIADKCRHSCCIGWEIDIDDDTFEYYKTVCEEYRAMYEDEADRFAPSAENSNQLKGFVKPSSITFPRTENERTVIVLFKTKWDLELGVGILLKNEKISLVGVQSDVL